MPRHLLDAARLAGVRVALRASSDSLWADDEVLLPRDREFSLVGDLNAGGDVVGDEVGESVWEQLSSCRFFCFPA